MGVDDSDDVTVADLERANTSSLRWKYVFLLVTFVLCACLGSYRLQTNSFDFSSVFQNIVSGVMASLFLALIYDVFISEQAKREAKIQQHKVISRLSKETFLKRGFSELSIADIRIIAEQLTVDDRFLNSLADIAARKTNQARSILHGFVKPLLKDNRTEVFAWENRLTRDPASADNYVWHSKQRFQHQRGKRNFRVALTDDIAIHSALINSDAELDSVLVVGDIPSSALPDITDGIHLSVQYFDSRRRREALQATTCAYDTLRDLVALSEDQWKKVSVLEFPLFEGLPDDAVLEYSFQKSLSLADPVFYVQANSLVFVSEISIDYLDISQNMSEEWLISFIGNIGAIIDHDKTLKRAVASVNGAIMAGQGLALVWTRATPPLNS